MPKSLFTTSACMEFLHNFMLIHDDIIDCSDLRRGKPTMHRMLQKATPTANPQKLGQDLSIIAGDIVYALAIDAFSSINEDPARKEKALKYFIKTAVLTAMGEFIDTLHGSKKVNEIKENDVFLNYTLKTAHYTIGCPLVVGALLAGAPPKDIARLVEFGLKIGQAFQIQDDLLGIFGSQKEIGKSILSDIAESKKTILVCHAYRTLSPQKRSLFLRYFNKNKKTYQDLITIRKIFFEAGSLHYSLKKIRTLITQARKNLNEVTMKPPYRQTIWDLLSVLFIESCKIAEEHKIKIVLK